MEDFLETIEKRGEARGEARGIEKEKKQRIYTAYTKGLELEIIANIFDVTVAEAQKIIEEMTKKKRQ
jgi:hypothetical protein